VQRQVVDTGSFWRRRRSGCAVPGEPFDLQLRQTAPELLESCPRPTPRCTSSRGSAPRRCRPATRQPGGRPGLPRPVAPADRRRAASRRPVVQVQRRLWQVVAVNKEIDQLRALVKERSPPARQVAVAGRDLPPRAGHARRGRSRSTGFGATSTISPPRTTRAATTSTRSRSPRGWTRRRWRR
jgi:hypothetical protein